MKKILATLTLGALLLTGFTLAESSATDLSLEKEPSIFSVQEPTQDY
ncbi:hypothetical protein [Oceanobacillus salinisoli]|nr:hypothetical protein [Oceanobacillus salinisoli]